MLPDVAERAKEVVPAEHRSRTILPARIAAPLFQRGYVGVTESPVAGGASLLLDTARIGRPCCFLDGSGFGLQRSAGTRASA
jgi:hypothetical protein